MRIRLPLVGFAAVALLQPLLGADYPYQPVPFTAVRITGGFWRDKQEVNRTVTVPYALKQCEESGRLKNFDLAAEVMRRRAAGERDFQITPPTLFPFDDTDAYKAIEGASYVLSMQPDSALDRQLDGWVARIAAAQEPDGYLYTFRTMHPDSPGHKWVGKERWDLDPKLSHELYDAGHLYEAGVAYYQATGKRTLLDVCLKNAELLWRTFGEGRRRLAPGHEIVEMGLVKLYRVTGDRRWLDLAKSFLDARGPGGPAYNQMHKLVVDQDEAVGHAVRANYLYSGMADVAALTGDERYSAAIRKIWENVAEKKLYLTGGVGALTNGEAYGDDYDLRNDAYNETCAAVALMMWNHRMFLLTGDAKYMDVFERTQFNGFISGVSVSGDRFFYPNPLVYDGHSKNNSGFAGRAPWFGCACCPPNLMRTLASLSGYFYAVKGDELYVNLYAQSEAVAEVAGTSVSIVQKTDYPWSGLVRLTVSPSAPARFTLKVRVPGWARNRPVPSDLYAYGVSLRPFKEFEKPPSGWPQPPLWCRVAGAVMDGKELEKGYVSITREWRSGDTVEMIFPMDMHYVLGNPQIAATRGLVALERGPVVYCVEEINQKMAADSLAMPLHFSTQWGPPQLGRVIEIKIRGSRSAPLTAIPYFAWNNRGLAPMAVWLPQSPGAPAL